MIESSLHLSPVCSTLAVCSGLLISNPSHPDAEPKISAPSTPVMLKLSLSPNHKKKVFISFLNFTSVLEKHIPACSTRVEQIKEFPSCLTLNSC